MNENSSQTLIEVRNLKKYFPVKNKGTLFAVDDISFTIRKGETLGLVGESGCGKSTVGNVLLRLLSASGGEIIYQGTDILSLNKAAQREYCKKMQIVFQDPYSSLNPKKTVRSILSESFSIHKLAKGDELVECMRKISEMTGITEDMWSKYPHELDGGKRQVVGIARALSLSPGFIVCDEPVSALDVSIQAKIINLLIDLQQKMELSYLFISHDLSVVRHISNRIAVMYLGKIVEMTETDKIFESPKHPYTVALLSAVLSVDIQKKAERIVLEGDVPSPINPKPGCRFAPRCWMVQEKCRQELPKLYEAEPGHFVACHYYNETASRLLNVHRKALYANKKTEN